MGGKRHFVVGFSTCIKAENYMGKASEQAKQASDTERGHVTAEGFCYLLSSAEKLVKKGK